MNLPHRDLSLLGTKGLWHEKSRYHLSAADHYRNVLTLCRAENFTSERELEVKEATRMIQQHPKRNKLLMSCLTVVVGLVAPKILNLVKFVVCGPKHTVVKSCMPCFPLISEGVWAL